MANEEFMLAKREDDLSYYEQRAREERVAAASATRPQIASAHRLLAIEYEAQARELRAQLKMPA
ncbi:MAG: hypothetical protein QM690_09265 [Sphingobium sp.]